MPFNDADPILDPFHIDPYIKGRQKMIVENRLGMKVSKSMEVQQKASPVCSLGIPLPIIGEPPACHSPSGYLCAGI
jgi:hypothetical protein